VFLLRVSGVLAWAQINIVLLPLAWIGADMLHRRVYVPRIMGTLGGPSLVTAEASHAHRSAPLISGC